MEEIQYGSHNSTALLRNGEFVEYSCYRGYKFRGEVAVRRCSDGVIVPSFHEQPLSCGQLTVLSIKLEVALS